MEKLKRALTGRDEEEDEERGFVAQVRILQRANTARLNYFNATTNSKTAVLYQRITARFY